MDVDLADDPADDPAADALARARASSRGRAPGTAPHGRRPNSGTRATGPGPDERDPILVGDAVQGLIDDRGWRGEAAVAALSGRWAEIVGTEVAQHVSMESFEADSRTLVVRADSTAWATQMRLLLPTLMERLGHELGRGVVGSVTVAGPSAPSWVKGPRTAPGRGPRDTYG